MTLNDLEEIINLKIDTDSWLNLADDFSRTHVIKYLRSPKRYVKNSVSLCRKLGLLESPPKKIFDVGCGMGFFVKSCEQLGHDAAGLDLDLEVFRCVNDLFPIKRIYSRVDPFEPLPADTGDDLDLITMTGVNVFIFAEVDMADACLFLRDDLRDRLSPGGMLYWQTNYGPETSIPSDPEFWSDWKGDVSIDKNEVRATKG